MSISKLIEEGIIQVRRPNSDRDRAHLQAAKREGPPGPGLVIRKKAVIDAPKTAPEPKAGEPSREELLKKVREFWKTKTHEMPKSDDSEHKQFAKWLATPGKGKRAHVGEGLDRASMHQEVAHALRGLARRKSTPPAEAIKHARDAKRKSGLARLYRKMQTPAPTK